MERIWLCIFIYLFFKWNFCVLFFLKLFCLLFPLDKVYFVRKGKRDVPPEKVKENTENRAYPAYPSNCSLAIFPFF